MSLRPARSADLDAVLAIQAACPALPPWTREQLEGEIRSGALTVGDEEGDVWGYAIARLTPPQAQLVMIAVDPSRRRQGFGRELLRSLIAAARGRRCDDLQLEVSAANGAALALYQAEGFAIVGRRAKFYNDGSDAILMDLDLS